MALSALGMSVAWTLVWSALLLSVVSLSRKTFPVTGKVAFLALSSACGWAGSGLLLAFAGAVIESEGELSTIRNGAFACGVFLGLAGGFVMPISFFDKTGAAVKQAGLREQKASAKRE
jgi:hypothetical protein